MMTGSPILDITIGLVLMYLMVSLFCSVLQEWISRSLSWRAANLEAAIIYMLGPITCAAEQPSVAAAVLRHPLVKLVPEIERLKQEKPSYLSANSFALGLISALRPARAADGTLTFGALHASVEALGQSNASLRTALTPILATAEGDLNKAIKGIEAWYDSTMERATGWYKRRATLCLFWTGFLLAAAVNADSIQVAYRLSGDQALRDKVAAYAATIAPPDAKLDEGVKKAQALVAKEVENGKFNAAFGPLPIGWQACFGTIRRVDAYGNPVHDKAGNEIIDQPFSPGACYGAKGEDILVSWGWAVPLKIVGLLMTGLMASLGGPFWFELLQKLNALRAAGPKPAPATPATPATPAVK